MLSLRRIRQDETGFSLVELLTVLVLVGVIGGVVVSTLVAGLGASRRTEERAHALNDLQLGLERMTRELRVATPILPEPDAGLRGFVIGAQVTRDGERRAITYTLGEAAEDGNAQLREQVVRRLLDDNTVLDTFERPLLDDLANRSVGRPMVEYLVIDPDSGELSAIGCAGLTDLECTNRLLTARQIRITLVRDLPEQDPIAVQTTVNVRNLRLLSDGAGAGAGE